MPARTYGTHSKAEYKSVTVRHDIILNSIVQSDESMKAKHMTVVISERNAVQSTTHHSSGDCNM